MDPDPNSQNTGVSLQRIAVENFFLALALWGVSHLNWVIFGKLGIQPMPIWPAAGLAFAAAFFRGWRVAPAIAVGTFLADYFSLGGNPVFACCIAITDTLAPIIGSGIIHRWVSPTFRIKGMGNLAVCLLAALALDPVISATGGITSKCLLGLMPGDIFLQSWTKWAMAHSLGIVFLALPVFAWVLTIEQEKENE